MCEYDILSGSYEESTSKALKIDRFRPVAVLLNDNPIEFDKQPFRLDNIKEER